jgi:hypothetical protein
MSLLSQRKIRPTKRLLPTAETLLFGGVVLVVLGVTGGGLGQQSSRLFDRVSLLLLAFC